jgi:hypothetical protein
MEESSHKNWSTQHWFGSMALCSQNDAICNQLWQRPCVQPTTPLPFHGHLITIIPYLLFDVALLLLFFIKQMVLCCKTTMTLEPCKDDVALLEPKYNSYDKYYNTLPNVRMTTRIQRISTLKYCGLVDL